MKEGRGASYALVGSPFLLSVGAERPLANEQNTVDQSSAECGSEYAEPNDPLLNVYTDAEPGHPSAVSAREVTGHDACESTETPPVDVEINSRVEVEGAGPGVVGEVSRGGPLCGFGVQQGSVEVYRVVLGAPKSCLCAEAEAAQRGPGVQE